MHSQESGIDSTMNFIKLSNAPSTLETSDNFKRDSDSHSPAGFAEPAHVAAGFAGPAHAPALVAGSPAAQRYLVSAAALQAAQPALLTSEY